VTAPAVVGLPGPAVAAVALPLQAGLGNLPVLSSSFLFGLYMVYKGFDEYRVSQLVRDTATETVQAAAVGRTELSGTAEPDDTVFHRPFTDGECLYARYSVKEESNSDDGSEWVSVAGDVWVAPFELDDGTGRIRVEPTLQTKFELSDEHTTEILVGEGEDPPPQIREFIEGVPEVEPDPDKRKYVETVLPPGESVYVLGGAEERDDASGGNAERLVVRRDEGSDRFLVSDMPQKELASTLTRRAPTLVLVGLLVSAGCLYGLLRAFGVG